MAQRAHTTLVAEAVSTLTVHGPGRKVKVLNLTGDSPLYFTVDGSTPTIEGADTFSVPAGGGGYGEADVTGIHANEACEVKVISLGADSVSAEIC